MPRSCPNCNKNIKSATALFCYYCGAKLDSKVYKNNLSETLEKERSDQKEEGHREIEHKALFPRVKQLSLILTPVLVLGVVAFVLKFEPSAFNFQKQKSDPQVLELVTDLQDSAPANTEILLPKDIWAENYEFGISKFESAVPFAADLYIESASTGDFISLNKNDLSDLFSLLETQDIKEVSEIFSKDFGAFYQDGNWGFFLKPGNIEEFKNKFSLENYEKGEDGYSIKMVGTYLLLFKDQSIVDFALEVEEKLIKNLGMDSSFLSALKYIPDKGLMFAYINNSNILKELSNDSVLEMFSLNTIDLAPAKNYFYITRNGSDVKLNLSN